MELQRLSIYDPAIRGEREVRGYRKGREWFYEDDTPIEVGGAEVMMIKGYRDNPAKPYVLYHSIVIDKPHLRPAGMTRPAPGAAQWHEWRYPTQSAAVADYKAMLAGTYDSSSEYVRSAEVIKLEPGQGIGQGRTVRKKQERHPARSNPYGSFARGGSQRGLTAKGRRMEEAIAETEGPGIGAATTYAAAKRGVPGLVKEKWAREHGYPEPNPGHDYQGGPLKIVRTGFTTEIWENQGVPPRLDWKPVATGFKTLPEAEVYLEKHFPEANRNPSEEESAKETADYLVNELSMDRRSAKKVTEDMLSSEGGADPNASYILQDINDYSKDGHGLYGVEDYYDGSDVVAQYVEVGDRYTQTVIFDYDDEMFHLTSVSAWEDKR